MAAADPAFTRKLGQRNESDFPSLVFLATVDQNIPTIAGGGPHGKSALNLNIGPI
jgi:hypothetical protein